MHSNEAIAARLGVLDLSTEVLGFIDYARQELQAAGTVEAVDPAAFPLEHRFTPGAYTRTILIRGPVLLASRVHLTTHPFIISRGEALVWSPEHGVQALMAHHVGITTPGTLRLLYVPVEVVWTTFHATTETDPEKIKESFTANPLTYRLHDCR